MVSTRRSTCCTHRLLARCCRHVPPIPVMELMTAMELMTERRTYSTLPRPETWVSSVFHVDIGATRARAEVQDFYRSTHFEKLRTTSQSDLPLSDWTSHTPSVLNRPSSLIPSVSPPPPPISPSSPAESTAKVRVHPSASFHIPHPTLTTLPATTTHRAAAPFPLSSPLARAGADSVRVERPHRVNGGVGG